MCFELRIALISNLILQVFSKEPEAVLNTPNTLFTLAIMVLSYLKAVLYMARCEELTPALVKMNVHFRRSGHKGNLRVSIFFHEPQASAFCQIRTSLRSFKTFPAVILHVMR